jgi:heptosyltransferase-2
LRPISPEKINRLLIRGTNWVGDAVMSVPALREIRSIFSKARISMLVRPWVRDVYSAVEFVDEIIEYDKKELHKGWVARRRLIADIRQREFEMVLLLQNAFEAAFHAWWAGIPLRVGYARDGRSLMLTHAVPIDPDVLKVHQGYYYLGILSGIGLFRSRSWQAGYRLSAAIGVRDSDREAARDLLRSKGIREKEIVVGLNPGAFYGGAKRWLSDRYAAVADALAKKYDARVIILGSGNERSIGEEIAGMMNRPPIVLSGETTLGQLMGLLKLCRLLVTNDSGPMHLAAALDVPQVAIFGSSSEIATGPLSSRAVVVKHPVDCSPCFRRECPIDFRCMTRISKDDVFVEACRVFEEMSSDPVQK